MKLNTIVGRGSIKDFIDLFFLMDYFTLNEMVHFYLQKYHDGSEFLVIKSLNYFDYADLEALPVMLKSAQWDDIKRKIHIEVEKYLKLKR